VTIYDIAKEAGVSPSTVSRVINNRPGVSIETQRKVQRLLKKYDYFPNETARGLVTKASKIIGILIDDLRTSHHTEGAYIIERELAKLGYCCIILNTGTEDESKAEYLKILRQRRVDGAVLMGSSFQNDTIKKAIAKYLPNQPVIMANGYLDLPNVYGVMADELNGVANCVKLLVSKGHLRPAFVIDKPTPSNLQKQRGYVEAVRNLGLMPEPLIYQCESSLQGAYAATQRIVKEHPEVDGIIYAVDLLAVSGVRALTDLKIAIPGQVSVIGVDNSLYAEISNPKLTSLDNKLLDLSIASAQTLINALKKRPTTKKILIYSAVVERETT